MGMLDKYGLGLSPPAKQPKISLRERLGFTSVAIPEEAEIFAESPETPLSGRAVRGSKDLTRIVALPRRAAAIGGNFEFLGKTNSGCNCKVYKPNDPCAKSLLKIQSQVLQEIGQEEGLLGPIGVGHGKTLMDLLAPMTMPGCKTAVLLIPVGLLDQLLSIDWPYYSQHWELPNLGTTGLWSPDKPTLYIIPYSQLSSPKSSALLEKIRPDLIIADEAHNLKHKASARTRRFLAYFKNHPETRFCGWSGTLTTKSLKDYAHLAHLALGDNTPLPTHWPTVEEWAGAIDPPRKNQFTSPMGALKALCEPGEHVRSAFRRRLVETPGVVATEESALACSLILEEREVQVPEAVVKAIDSLKDSWATPDGEELITAMDVAGCAKELASGFYYRRTWPNNEPLEVRAAWLDARKNWHRELRERLKHPKLELDSEFLATQAAIRWHEGYVFIDPETGVRTVYPPGSKNGPRPTWAAEHWPRWKELRKTAKPSKETIWIDEYLVRDSCDWMQKNTGIVWYTHVAFGEKLAEISKAPFYGPGPEAAIGIVRESGKKSIIASINSHREGRNLQAFSNQLIANPPTDGGWWEQLLGRTHRPNQQADEVYAWVYRHTSDLAAAVDSGIAYAGYIQETQGTKQKLVYATKIFKTLWEN